MYSLDFNLNLNCLTAKEDKKEDLVHLNSSSLQEDDLNEIESKLEKDLFQNEKIDDQKTSNSLNLNKIKLNTERLMNLNKDEQNIKENHLNGLKKEKLVSTDLDTSSIIYDSIIVSFNDENLKQSDNLDYLKFSNPNLKEEAVNDQENNEIIIDLKNVQNLNNDNQNYLTDLMVLEEKPINHQWPINLPQNSLNSNDSWFYFDKYFMHNEEQILNDCSIGIHNENNISSSNTDLIFKFEDEEHKSYNESNSNNVYHSHLFSGNMHPLDFHIHHASIHNSQNRHFSSVFTSNLINSGQQQPFHYHHHISPIKNDFNSDNLKSDSFNEKLDNSQLFLDQATNSFSTSLIAPQFSIFENDFIYNDQQSSKTYSTSLNSEIKNINNSNDQLVNDLIINDNQILQSKNIEFENELQNEQSILIQPTSLYQHVNPQYLSSIQTKNVIKLENENLLQNNQQVKNTNDVLLNKKHVGTGAFKNDFKQVLSSNQIKVSSGKKLISLKEAANVKLEKVKIERANGMKIYYFKCSLCSYQTNTSQSMKDHLYCIHCKAKNNYKCNICHQTFGWKNNAQRHMRRKHKIEDQTTKREAIITLI